MPLTLNLSENVLPKGQEPVAMAKLIEAMIRHHGLAGNAVMAANVIGTYHILSADQAMIGDSAAPVAIIEWKVPSVLFADRAVQQAYFAEATDIIHTLSGGTQPRERIFINVVHAVDGAWNFNGVAMTNAEIGAALSA